MRPHVLTPEGLDLDESGIDQGAAKAKPAAPTSSERPRFGSQTGPPFEKVLSSQEAAALLKIHPKTLQKLARKGLVPGVRIGKLWAFRASALDRWLESKLAM